MGRKDFAQSADRLQPKAETDTGGQDLIKDLLKPANPSLQDTASQTKDFALPVEERKSARVLLVTKPSTKAKIAQLAKSQHSNFNDLVNRLMEAYIKQGKEQEQ